MKTPNAYHVDNMLFFLYLSKEPASKPVVEEIKVKATHKSEQTTPQKDDATKNVLEAQQSKTESQNPADSTTEEAEKKDESYSKMYVTSSEDYTIRDKLDEAEDLLVGVRIFHHNFLIVF
jgi:hypothetical protein